MVAKKVDHHMSMLESEASMLHYATSYGKVKGPRLHDVILEGETRTMITDFDSGVPLDKVWKKLKRANQKLIVQ